MNCAACHPQDPPVRLTPVRFTKGGHVMAPPSWLPLHCNRRHWCPYAHPATAGVPPQTPAPLPTDVVWICPLPILAGVLVASSPRLTVWWHGGLSPHCRAVAVMTAGHLSALRLISQDPPMRLTPVRFTNGGHVMAPSSWLHLHMQWYQLLRRTVQIEVFPNTGWFKQSRIFTTAGSLAGH